MKQEYLASMFISGADNGRYKALKNELENDYAKGTDFYPKTVKSTVMLMNRYKPNKSPYIKPRGDTKNNEA